MEWMGHNTTVLIYPTNFDVLMPISTRYYCERKTNA